MVGLECGVGELEMKTKRWVRTIFRRRYIIKVKSVDQRGRLPRFIILTPPLCDLGQIT